MNDPSACAVEWCVKPATNDELCKRHHHYRRSHGRLPYAPHFADDRQKLHMRIRRQDNGCWIWTGAKSSKTHYGVVRYAGRNMPAHRAMWLEERGPIPPGLELDHLCRVRLCVNPDHLEPVTPAENTRRGNGTLASDLYCANGHSWTDNNLIFRKPDGVRECRTCNREKTRRYRERNRSA